MVLLSLVSAPLRCYPKHFPNLREIFVCIFYRSLFPEGEGTSNLDFLPMDWHTRTYNSLLEKRKITLPVKVKFSVRRVGMDYEKKSFQIRETLSIEFTTERC